MVDPLFGWLSVFSQIKELKAKLGDEEAAASFTSVKAEPAASDGPPVAGVGSSESDSSAVLNDADAPAGVAEAPVPEVQGALLPTPAAAAGAATSHGGAFFHGGFLKVEEDETGFLDDDEPCGGFFAVEQPPPMAWWTEPTEHCLLELNWGG
jgi:homeobox-leucine zipper protein